MKLPKVEAVFRGKLGDWLQPGQSIDYGDMDVTLAGVDLDLELLVDKETRELQIAGIEMNKMKYSVVSEFVNIPLGDHGGFGVNTKHLLSEYFTALINVIAKPTIPLDVIKQC